MSVATDLVPEVYIPVSARRRSLRLADPASRRCSGGLGAPGATRKSSASASPIPAAPAAAALGAEVISLDRWRHQTTAPAALFAPATRRPLVEAAPVRLTRRGVIALVAMTLLAAIAVLVVAWVSAPRAASVGAGRSTTSIPTTSMITVRAGDSLWTIAREAAPTRDPRSVVDELRRLNHLADDTVTPGQKLVLQ